MKVKLRSLILGTAFLECAVLLLLFLAGRQYWLYSEEAVREANVENPLFVTAEHFYPEYWRNNATQGARLGAIEDLLHAGVQAFRQLGLPVFLESANLIGHARHGRQMVPWDTDGDLGFLESDCRKVERSDGAPKGSSLVERLNQALANVDVVSQQEDLGKIQRKKGKSKRQKKAAPSPFKALFFGCRCEENGLPKGSCEGVEKRVAGRLVHTGSGTVVDVFGYALVKKMKRRGWQRHLTAQEATTMFSERWGWRDQIKTSTCASTSTAGSCSLNTTPSSANETGTEEGAAVLQNNGSSDHSVLLDKWYERVGDTHSDFTFPVSSLLPLRSDVFGTKQFPVQVPNRPAEWLSWEYGPCVLLGPHMWPWDLLLNVTFPAGSFISVAGIALALGFLGLIAARLVHLEEEAGLSKTQSSSQASPAIAQLSVSARSWSAFLVGDVCPKILAAYLFDNGIAVVAALCLAGVALVVLPSILLFSYGKHELRGSSAARSMLKLASPVLVGGNTALLLLAAFQLRSVQHQLGCHIEGQYFSPMRPKTWTLCLFGVCRDFT
ncbi:unnamed protein product [Amoebophrya sp. A120]|nr:unnamed protein product [Amoebophrya sp. A120]|eukprot:GSA120T00005354001.1